MSLELPASLGVDGHFCGDVCALAETNPRIWDLTAGFCMETVDDIGKVGNDYEQSEFMIDFAVSKYFGGKGGLLGRCAVKARHRLETEVDGASRLPIVEK